MALFSDEMIQASSNEVTKTSRVLDTGASSSVGAVMDSAAGVWALMVGSVVGDGTVVVPVSAEVTTRLMKDQTNAYLQRSAATVGESTALIPWAIVS